MAILNCRDTIGRIRDNVSGWRTNRKILVIESDDWGSIRMPSKSVFQRCLGAGYPVNESIYERYDSLLSYADLNLLFNLLSDYKDHYGRNPTITANCVVANPNFEQIRQNNFQKYSYELITDTFTRYPLHSNNFEIWKEAINNDLFLPQFHAREHLNVSLFMEALQSGDKDAHFAFNNQMPGCIPWGSELKENFYVEASKYNSESDKNQKLEIILDGLDLFKKLFGFSSKTITPPNYIWSRDYDKAVFEKGIIAFQGLRRMIEPMVGKEDKIHSNHLGKKNSLGQIYLIRNVLFEPSMMHKLKITDPVDKCLFDIGLAFKFRKPAILCSHRINYVGYIDEGNRDKSLKMLNGLLTRALKEWPDIEFMNSVQLSEMISS